MSYFTSDTITFEAAILDLQSHIDGVRARAAVALGDAAAENRDDAVAALVPVLNDLKAQIRASAATSLGELGGAAAVEALILTLDDGAPHVRQTAAIALGRIGDDAAFVRLVEALEEGPADLRFQAATSLVEIDADRARGALLDALDDKDDEVLSAVALGLGAIGDPAVCDRLSALLENARRDTRFDAAYALARLGDGRGAAVLTETLKDPKAAWDAVEALEVLGTREAAEGLGAVFEDRKASRQLRIRAAGALLAIDPAASGHERARHELTSALAVWWKLEIRGLAIEQLGRAGGMWAVAPLERLAQRRSGRVLADAIEAALAAIAERGDS
jgi:HEAT repeat protein